MNKILLVPLDERPCNYEYPLHLGVPRKMLSLPPKNLLGSKKRPGDFEALKTWLLSNIQEYSHVILSIDQWVYGGLIPSRLHFLDEKTLLERLHFIRELKTLNPALTIYGFVMIMRNPFYSSDDEEPTYYAYDGSNIYKSGYYADKKEKTGALTLEEEADYQKALSALRPENLKDYLSRRSLNLQIVEKVILLKKQGILDYLVIPQDDSSPFGYTKKDQERIRGFIDHQGIQGIDIYPGADEVGMVLLARAVQDMTHTKTFFEPIFACENGQNEIPPFEDRPFIQSLTSQVHASGSLLAFGGQRAIKLFINIASKFLDKNDPDYHQSYEVDRNLPEFINRIHECLQQNEKVAIADVAMPNGGDPELLEGLDRNKDALKLHAYAGWNTSSNTLGTTLAQAIIYDIFHNVEQNRYFLLHRYYEDVGYMSYVRKYVCDHYLSNLGLDYFNSGSKKGPVSSLVEITLQSYMSHRFPNLSSEVAEIDIQQPWVRMFETDLQLVLKSPTKVAIDIGGTFIKGGRVKEGKILAFAKAPTHGNIGREAILESLYSVIDELMDDEVTGIGISTAGDINAVTGTCTFASDNLKGWTGLNIKSTLEDRYHWMTFVDNDAYCHLNAEKRLLKPLQNITLLTFGTGVGGASLLDGQLDRSVATKWGYRVIVPEGRYLAGANAYGVAEAYLSARNVLEALEPLKGSWTIDDLFKALVEGNPEAKTVLQPFGYHLNLLLALIQKEVHPDVILLGGGLVANNEAIRLLISPEINNVQFARYGNDAGIIGAYYLPFRENE